MVNDTISDVLTRIRNGCLIQSQIVLIPLTKLSEQICHTLQKEGFIDSFKRDAEKRSFEITLKYKAATYSNSNSSVSFKGVREARVLQLSKAASTRKPCITNLRRISKPGLRVYTRAKQIPTVLGGMGILIISTSQGIMTDREARFRGIGGEIVCSVW